MTVYIAVKLFRARQMQIFENECQPTPNSLLELQVINHVLQTVCYIYE